MPDDLAIRRYRPDDAEAVWDVHEAALRASPLAFVEEAAVDEDITDVETHYLDAGGDFLVGTLDDEIAAIGGYLPVGERTVEIRRMRVDPEHQREGYASAVLGALEERAREEGCETAVLETIEPLEAARAFYDDAGYDVAETSEDDATGVTRYRYRRAL